MQFCYGLDFASNSPCKALLNLAFSIHLGSFIFCGSLGNYTSCWLMLTSQIAGVIPTKLTETINFTICLTNINIPLE